MYLKSVLIMCLAIITQVSVFAKNKSVDYYEMYNNNQSFTVGDITVNKTNFPKATLIEPADMKNTTFKVGGLLFIDNSDSKKLTFESSTKGMSVDKDLIVVGRYAQEEQAEIILNQYFSCHADLALKNLKLTAGKIHYMFGTSGAKVDPKLVIEDCDLFSSSSVIYDSHISKNYRAICVNNSTIEFEGTVAGKALISLSSKKEPNTMKTLESIKLTNNVIYAQNPRGSYLINIGAQPKATEPVTSNVDIVVTNNTIYNLCQPNILIRTTEAKAMNVSDNVACFKATDKLKRSYLTAIFDKSMTSAVVTGNYLYTEDFVPSEIFWSPRHTGGYSFKGNVSGADAVDPIGKGADIKDGYFPINRSVVTNGAGANYDNKYWIKKK